MAKARVRVGLVAGCLALCGGSAFAAPLPTVQQMLTIYHPHFDGVNCSTPTAQDEASCKVEIQTGRGQGSGYLLRDPQGRPLRRFYNTRFTAPGDHTKIDVWSYYKDGVEVYREWATTNGEPPDQFRWMNAGGSKWATGTVDAQNHAHVTAWKQISPEEVSQEVLQAVVAHDFTRLQPLFLSDAEMKALEMPAAEAARLQELRRGAPAKFEATAAKLNGLTDKTHWLHLETTAPQCQTTEQAGGHDVVKYANASVLCETAGKNDWLQTGELVQVGAGWRIVDAPAAGLAEPATPDTPGEVVDKAMQPLIDQLHELDTKEAPKAEAPGPNPAVVHYNLARADLLEQVIEKAKPEKRDPWIRQLADCLTTASQASPGGDRTAYKRLLNLEEQIVKAMPGSGLAAYITYREMTADNAAKISDKDNAPNFGKLQEQWVARLTKFVQDYPRAEDTPDALLQLGWVSEFMNKETEAKNWYQQLVSNFADAPQAKKADGAHRRLEIEGKPMELTGPTLAGGAFDINQLRGKVVVVYYWASWNDQCASDFAKLKALADKYGGQGMELVTVNLDAQAKDATDFLARSPLPGTHLFQPGGLDSSPLALQYGIMGLPTLFLVGKDGKVLSRTVQVGTLDESVKQQLK
ncbi:MAG TPA: thioredoxin-like domain-containing protein [Gemmataceae bacterium]|nr:thioredoxin-like domain-containing protein [Gemmataceae bacterium]